MSLPNSLDDGDLQSRTSDSTHVDHMRAVKDQDAAGDAEENAAESYRLLSIAAARAPDGCAGRDWLVYRIAQGDNVITGYRRGDLESVSAEVETIVAGLNGRRQWAKKKPDAKARRRAEAAARRKGAE